jgi:hypothetical protein
LNQFLVHNLFIALMMEAASTSETSVNFYQTTRGNIPEDSHLNSLTFITLISTSDIFTEHFLGVQVFLNLYVMVFHAFHPYIWKTSSRNFVSKGSRNKFWSMQLGRVSWMYLI